MYSHVVAVCVLFAGAVLTFSVAGLIMLHCVLNDYSTVILFLTSVVRKILHYLHYIWRSFHELGGQNCPIRQLVATVNEKLFCIQSLPSSKLGNDTAQFMKWAVSQIWRNIYT